MWYTCFCSSLGFRLKFWADEVSELLSKNKQNFRYLKFLKYFKKVTLIQKVVSRCFDAYDILFWQESQRIWSFRPPDMFLFTETVEYVIRPLPMHINQFLSRRNLRHFLIIIGVHFVVSLSSWAICLSMRQISLRERVEISWFTRDI